MLTKLKEQWASESRLRKIMLVRSAVVLLVICVAVVVLVARPFEKETGQINDFRSLTQTERQADTLSRQVDDFLKREQSLKAVVTSGPQGIAKMGEMGYTWLEIEGIDAEYELAASHALVTGIQREKQLASLQADIEIVLSILYK